MAESLQPLLVEMQKTNAGVQKLVDQGIEDDTLKQLFMGNFFEIANARDLFSQEAKILNTNLRVGDGGEDIGDLSKKLLDSLALDSNADGIPKLIRSIVKLEDRIAEFMNKNTEITLLQGQMTTTIFKDLGIQLSNKLQDSIDIISERNKQDELEYRQRQKEEDERKKEAERLKLAEQENKKDQRGFFKTAYDTFLEGIKAPFKAISEGLSSLSDGLVGKVGLVTLFILGISALLAYVPIATTAFKEVFLVIANFISDFKNFFTGKIGLGEFIGNQFAVFVGGGILLFFKSVRTSIMGFLVPLSAKIAAIGTFLLRFVALPAAIFKAIFGFMEGFTQSREAGAGIMEAIGKGLEKAVKNVVSFIFGIIGQALEFVGRMLLGGQIVDSIKGFFTGLVGDIEGKALGGPVAAGTPYVVGERGPELFVPGAAGGIMPGLGGGNIVVNNNQVNQSAQTANHQHSNITIVDRQQEQTGL